MIQKKNSFTDRPTDQFSLSLFSLIPARALASYLISQDLKRDDTLTHSLALIRVSLLYIHSSIHPFLFYFFHKHFVVVAGIQLKSHGERDFDDDYILL